MQPSGPPRDRGAGGFGGKLLPEPYDSFMRSHLRYYGYFQAPRALEPVSGQDRWVPSARGQGTSVPSVQHRRSPGDPRDLFTLPWAQGPLPAPRWPIECEVIKEPIEHIEWVPPEPEPFCPPAGPARPLAPLSEDQGTVVYQLSPAPPGSCFTRARIGGSPGPLSLPATPLEGPQDTTLIFESRFESGNLQKAVKVGPFEYVLWLRPDLYTAKHTQWFYFRVQNTRRDHLYRFTIANLAKPKSLYNEGMRPLLYSQRDAESCGIGWRRVGTDIRYYRRGAEEPAAFCLSWTVCFPHDGDTCFFAHSYPYTYSDLRRYLRALCRDPARSRLCTVRALCRSLAGNTVYLLTIGSPAAAAGKRVVVLSARAHPGESGGSWAMRGLLDFLLSADADAQLLRRLFDFMVVPMLNPDGVVVGNSRCSLAGRDPNRAYGTARGGSFPGVWHLRAMVERVLAEREVVLYCDFHGHSRKNNVFMYGCDGGGAGSGSRLRQRVFPLMLSKNAPDKFSFPSCKFKVQKSKAGTGRVVMWRLGVLHSYTMEAAFGGSTLGEGAPWVGVSVPGVLLGGWSPGWDAAACSVVPRPLQAGGTRTSPCRTSSRWAPSCATPCSTSATPTPPSCSGAWRRWTRCCGGGCAGSRAAVGGAACPPRSLSPAPAAPTPPCPTGPRFISAAQNSRRSNGGGSGCGAEEPGTPCASQMPLSRPVGRGDASHPVATTTPLVAMATRRGRSRGAGSERHARRKYRGAEAEAAAAVSFWAVTPGGTMADAASQVLLGSGLTVLSQPLMYVKVLVQVGYEPLPPTLGRNVFGRQVYQLPGLFAYAKHIVKVDGRAGLFKGLTPRLCSSAIGTVVHSKVLQRYQEAEQAEPGSSKKEPVSSLEQVLKETSREMVARSAATLITHPFHVITLRCMVQFIGRETKYSGTLSAFATIYREEGILGFFAGLIPRLLGDILSLWLCNMLAYLINTYALENGASTMTEMKSYSQAVTGFFASMLTYPFVLVSNLMAVNNCGLAGGLLPYAPTYSSWLDCWSQLHREGNMSRGNSLFFRKVPAGKRYVWDERRFR